MKRTYQNPQMKVVAIRHLRLLNESLTSTGVQGEISGYSSNSGGGFTQDE